MLHFNVIINMDLWPEQMLPSVFLLICVIIFHPVTMKIGKNTGKFFLAKLASFAGKNDSNICKHYKLLGAALPEV